MADYAENIRVNRIALTDTPQKGRTVTGYGGALPTDILIDYRGDDNRVRRYRVKVMNYGNSGSAYIVVKGKTLFLDTDTEHDVIALRNGY